MTLNQEILKHEKWTLKEIDERNDKLIDEFISLYPYLSAPESVIAKHIITIASDEVSASAILYEEDGSVEISENSEISKYGDETPEWCVDWLASLVEEGIVKKTDNGQCH